MQIFITCGHIIEPKPMASVAVESKKKISERETSVFYLLAIIKCTEASCRMTSPHTWYKCFSHFYNNYLNTLDLYFADWQKIQ